MTARTRRTAPIVSVSLLLLFATGALCAAPTWTIRLRFPPTEAPDVYVQVQGAELLVAASADGLAEAKPLKAVDKRVAPMGRNRMYQTYSFPEATLPVKIAGASNIRGQFTFSRVFSAGEENETDGNRATIYGQVRIAKPDAEGVTWTYLAQIGESPTVNQDPEESPVVSVADLSDLKLTIETLIEGRKARIGLRVMVGDSSIGEVSRNGKPARARIEVTDARGNVVHAQRGDLEKFGFT